jgi:hypothetical protein
VIDGPHDDQYDLNALEGNGELMIESLTISPININNPASKLENLNFEVQLKSIVSRIKDFSNQIKEKVRSHRELSETFI